MKRRGDADLDAELVRPMRLALADALDLRRVQGIDLAPALAVVLRQHAPGEAQRLAKTCRSSGRPTMRRAMSRITRPR